MSGKGAAMDCMRVNDATLERLRMSDTAKEMRADVESRRTLKRAKDFPACECWPNRDPEALVVNFHRTNCSEMQKAARIAERKEAVCKAAKEAELLRRQYEAHRAEGWAVADSPATEIHKRTVAIMEAAERFNAAVDALIEASGE